MTVAKVKITRHERGVGWFRMTLSSLPDSIGTTKMELLLREETLRAIREGADRALNGQPDIDIEQLLKSED